MVAATLEKLTIRIETALGEFGPDGVVEALFNPNQITIQKSSTWGLKPKKESDIPKVQFTHGQPATLSMDLFFDTYAYRSGEDVRKHTNKIYSLTTVRDHGDLHRPPLCKIEWGSFNISEEYQCNWVLSSLNQRFTLFLSDGTPVRATLGCSFRQWRGDEAEARALNKSSADVAKTRTVRRGDTLSSIATEQYDDPTLWRPIAEENNIDDARVLSPGRPLIIPSLRKRNGTRR